MVNARAEMPYVRMGKTGLKVSKLGFGAWVTFGTQVDLEQAKKILQQCLDAGINFFDNAEVYEAGKAEEIMGQAFKDLGTPRKDYVLTTKLMFGGSGPNDKGLSRKHIIEGAKASLKRLQTDYVDVIYAHRPDPTTPIEETVRAFNFVIEQGWAFYWFGLPTTCFLDPNIPETPASVENALHRCQYPFMGRGTSEWSAQQIQEAIGVADRLGLIPPTVEQPQYNLFERRKVESEFLPLYSSAHGYGLTIWSPLASGLLTGKYSKDHLPEGSRFAMEKYKGLKARSIVEEKLNKVEKLKAMADELGATLPQLAIAWTAKNDHVSVVLLGATKQAQIEDNIESLKFIDKLTPEVLSKIDEIFGNKP